MASWPWSTLASSNNVDTGVDDDTRAFAHTDFRFERLIAAPIDKQVFRVSLDVLLQEMVVVAVAHGVVIRKRLMRQLVLFEVNEHGAQSGRNVFGGQFQRLLPNDQAPEARRPPPIKTCMAGMVAPFRRMELP